MVSKRDEVVWDDVEFPSESDSLDESQGNYSGSDPKTPSQTFLSSEGSEIVPALSSLSVETPELPTVQISESAPQRPLAVSAALQVAGTTRVPADTASVVAAPVQPPRQLVRGERLDLKSLLFGESRITFELLGPNPGDVKFLCLGLDKDERLLGPEYCVGPRQTSSPCGGILYQATSGGGHSIDLCPANLPTNLKRLEFSAVAAAADGVVGKGAAGVRIRTSRGSAESADQSPECASSACATLVEVYERQGEWRLRVIGEVLAKSVDELLKKHGAARGAPQ